MIEITFKNSARIISAYSKAPQDVSRAIQRGIERSGVFAEGTVKSIITAGTGMWKPPIDTGQMRQGIHATFSPGKSVVRPSSHTPYATYVHEGTRRMRARPFFEITKQTKEGKMREFFTKEIELALDKLNI
jgi:HK97 gp10 family phage protein